MPKINNDNMFTVRAEDDWVSAVDEIGYRLRLGSRAGVVDEAVRLLGVLAGVSVPERVVSPRRSCVRFGDSDREMLLVRAAELVAGRAVAE